MADPNNSRDSSFVFNAADEFQDQGLNWDQATSLTAT